MCVFCRFGVIVHLKKNLDIPHKSMFYLSASRCFVEVVYPDYLYRAMYTNIVDMCRCIHKCVNNDCDLCLLVGRQSISSDTEGKTHTPYPSLGYFSYTSGFFHQNCFRSRMRFAENYRSDMLFPIQFIPKSFESWCTISLH